MSKLANSCCKIYKAPIMSEPSNQERMLAKWLALMNEKLDGTGYKYVVDRDGQLRLVLINSDNSAYNKALYEKRTTHRASASASPDAENEDPFFKAMRKVHERSTYGMHTIYEPKQLTIDDTVNGHT